ncbi:MAG: hypothetical protein AAGF97_10165 [Planctomycetota bacterium]
MTLVDNSLLDFTTTPRITVPAMVTDQGGLTGNGFMVVTPQIVDGDFNDDGVYDCADIDALVAAIASGTNVGSFDLTADGVVDLADRDAWLFEAGAVNLGPGRAYLVGDANLDGTVDGADFTLWNANKFTLNASWCNGDFNADGRIDGLDWIQWNNHKFQSSDGVTAASTPSTEPFTDGSSDTASAQRRVDAVFSAPAPQEQREDSETDRAIRALFEPHDA